MLPHVSAFMAKLFLRLIKLVFSLLFEEISYFSYAKSPTPNLLSQPTSGDHDSSKLKPKLPEDAFTQVLAFSAK